MKKKILIAIVAIAVLSGSITFYFFKIYKTPEERDMEAMLKGWDIRIGGKITEINTEKKYFILDEDYLGNHKFYTIHFNDKTVFIKKTYYKINTDNMDPDTIPEKRPAKEETSAPEELKNGVLADVIFEKRIDIDSGEKLTAVKIIIVERKITNQ